VNATLFSGRALRYALSLDSALVVSNQK
jgi:hypothetical protein